MLKITLYNEMKTLKSLCSALVVAAVTLGACTSQAPEGMYVVEGRLRNVPDSTVVRLYVDEGGMFTRPQSDTVIGGRFTICDSIDGTAPRKMALMSHSKGFPGTWLEIWVQSGKCVRVTGDDCLLPLWNVESEVEEQRYVSEFQALRPKERRQMLQWMAEEADLFLASRGQALDVAGVASLRSLYEPLVDTIHLAELEYMKEAPVTAVWLDQMERFCSILQYNPGYEHADLIRSLYARMSEADRQTEAGRTITAYMNLPERVDVGDDIVDGDMYDLEGNVRHLSEFSGQHILLDFWSCGCAPCIQSLPELEEISGQYRGRLAVVSVSQDPEGVWKEAVDEHRLTGNQWNELRQGNTGLAASYGVTGIPHYVMISPQGKVLKIWSGYGEGSLKAELETLLK